MIPNLSILCEKKKSPRVSPFHGIAGWIDVELKEVDEWIVQHDWIETALGSSNQEASHKLVKMLR